MRIRKKLVVLHTAFSIVLALLLLVALRPALNEVVRRAESAEARSLLDTIAPALANGVEPRLAAGVTLHRGSASDLGLTPAQSQAAMLRQGSATTPDTDADEAPAILALPGGDFATLRVSLPDARDAVTQLYLLVVAALLAVYAGVVIALEVFVLPQSVYEPIRQMYAADLAVADGRQDEEIIPEQAIPADELGDIMRSRNQTVRRLRQQEAALAEALGRIEIVATDLRRKNHLLEAARKNLADADRLASLGMMSAGIAHELNTPLAVLKGLVEQLNAAPAHAVDPAQAALMLRVVGRLERLSDGLLDFARVRPPSSRPVAIRTAVQEAVTLVRLDRDVSRTEISNAVSESLVAECDPDRMVQVFVNLIRNAADAILSAPASPSAGIRIEANTVTREGSDWASITVTDSGPGIDAAILPNLFEPFASTRLDSRGTGLGLAVAEGIVREHSGVLLARNRTDQPGAIFEVLLPIASPRKLPDRADANPSHA